MSSSVCVKCVVPERKVCVCVRVQDGVCERAAVCVVCEQKSVCVCEREREREREKSNLRKWTERNGRSSPVREIEEEEEAC